MRKSLAVLSCAGMAGVLSACSGAWDVEGLKSSTVSGNAFDQALRDEYVALADYERVQCDWRDTAAYVARGKLSAAGTPPAPEAIVERDLPDAMVAPLTAARAQVTHFLTAKYKAEAPKVLASAQAGYECWMEQQEENHQADDIAACRKKLDVAIKTLTDMENAKRPTPFIVYFGLSSAKLQGDAMAVIKEAAATFKSTKANHADVAGFADRSGSTGFNDRLSSLRAEAVGEALVKLGVPEAAVTISAFGESDLAIKTIDGQKEPRNRRVLISIVK
ncbi:MAG: OmpA family protein [Rhodospirillaceae bacterium]|nr:OmpA family protein [Rhodospirillaceae bacterium]